MTTATARTRRPRPLRVFHVERRSCVLPVPLAAILIGERQHNQADVLVAAPTKAAALERLRALGFHNSTGHLSMASGRDMDALQAAGMLDHDGDVLAFRDSIDGHVVVRVRGGEDAPVPVGAWRYDRDEYRMVFDASSPAVCQDCGWTGPETHRLFEDHIRCPRCRSVEVFVFDQPRDDA